ncbi:MAG: conjugal transfer protein TraC [Dehalococcoidia bacterium]|nr:conjugal transfer protein TraC [Dehalococcoidia bacterium]
MERIDTMISLLPRIRKSGGSRRLTAAEERFHSGTRSVADVVSPAGLDAARSHLLLDGRYLRILGLAEYPRYVYANWLGRLVDFDAPLDISLHVDPLDSGTTIRQLTHRLVEFQSSRMLDARSGKIASAEREVAYEDVERLRDALQRGEERVFSASLYLCLRSPAAAALDDLTRRVDAALSGMLASARPALYEMLPGLLSCLPAGQDHLGRRRNLETTSLATMIPFTSSHLSMDRGILYGISVHNNSLVIFDPFSRELENANKVVFAKSGAGKSYACKVEALRALMLGVEYYVIDPEDEYRRVCDAVGGQYIRLSGSSAHRINPFDLPAAVSRTDGEDGDPLTERLQSLQGLLGLMLADRGSTLSQREKGALDAALLETYRRAGITRDPQTHKRPAPVLRDLYNLLREQGDSHGLADRLERYVDGSLGQVFSSPTSVDLDRPFVVFNVRDLDADLRPLGVYLIADYIWRQVRTRRRPRMLLIDEAWSLMQHAEGARFLSSMARQARKYYLGLTTVTQDVEDFLATPEGHTVLANSSVQLLMRQDSSTIDAVSQTFRLSAGEREFLLACRKGEGLFFAQGNHIALRVEASPMEHSLVTTDPAELVEREEVPLR